MHNTFGEFSCLFAAPWKEDANNPNLICGKWAEDQSSYVLEVPPQLRDTIISLQNALYLKYEEIEGHRLQLFKLEREVSSIFNG